VNKASPLVHVLSSVPCQILLRSIDCFNS
jgi:hypothetical protein